MKGSIFFMFFLLLIQQIAVQAEDLERIKDLSALWYYNDGNISLPYVKGNNLNPQAIHFELNLKRYPDNFLVLKHRHPGVIFVNGKVFHVTEKEVNLNLPVDSLRNLFAEDEIWITYFSEKKDYDRLITNISSPTFTFRNASPTDDLIMKNSFERSGLLVILLLILVFFAIVFNANQKSFQDFYSIEQAVAGRIKDDSVYKLKLFSQNNLILFLFHSSIMSFLVILLSRYSNSLSQIESLFSNSLFINWCILSLAVFITFFIKYIVIRYIGELFDLGNSANYYFYEFMRLSMTFFLILLGVASVIVISFPHAAHSMVRLGINITFIFMFIRLIFLFFRIGKVSGFKNVHLFSYLCTTETLPIIVGMRYFLA